MDSSTPRGGTQTITVPPAEYLTPADLTVRYSGTVTVKTLANWRSTGEGPAYTKIGGKILYARRDVIAWENSRRQTGARAAGARKGA